MAQCPSCQSSIEIGPQHHGALYNCTHCNAVFFVGWDGQPEMPEVHEPIPVEPVAPYSAPNEEAGADVETPGESPYGFSPESEFSDNAYALPQDSGSTDASAYAEAIPEGTFEPTPDFDHGVAADALEVVPVVEEEVSSELSSPEEQASSEANYDFSQPLGYQPEVGVEVPSDSSSDLSSIADFGNQDVDLGALRYSVVIEGIDSSQTRALIKEALEDSKFGWNVDEILMGLGRGRLQIDGLSAVKAAILIKRIRHLPISVKWGQSVFG